MNNKKVNIIQNFFNRSGKELLLTCFGQGLYLLQNVVQNKIFTTCFSTEVFGEWTLVASVFSLISMLPFSAIDQGLFKYAYEFKKEGIENQLFSCVGIGYVIFFLIYTFILLILRQIQGESFFAIKCFLPFLLYVFSEVAMNSLVLLENSYRNRKKVLYLRCFSFTSRISLFLILFSCSRFTLNNVLWVLVGTNAVMLFFEKEILDKISFNIDIQVGKVVVQKVVCFATPLLTWAIFGWMQNMISKWYLDAILDLDAVAMYAVLTTLSYFVPNAIYTIVSAYIYPIAFSKSRAISRMELLRFLGIVATILLGYVVLTVLAGKYIIVLFTHSKYIGTAKYLPITTVSASLYVLSMLSTVEIYRQGETKKLILSTVFPGLFMATLGYFFIKKYGFTGAVINYILGHLLYTVLTSMVVFNKKNIK